MLEQLVTEKTCKCDFCVDHAKYKWAVVMNCPCSCHSDDGMTGHSGLCCEIPNGLKAKNPYPELEDIEVCKKVIADFHEKWKEEEL